VRNHGQQGCLGCHEDPERTPPNRFVKALASPAPLLNLPPDKRRRVTYADVAPVVEQKCLTCHGRDGHTPRLDAGATALAPYVTAGEARRSPLVWHLMGRSTARPWDPVTSAVPKPIPAGGTPLSADEIRAFVEWIDLGGQP
jgi:hypothetical protein